MKHRIFLAGFALAASPAAAKGPHPEPLFDSDAPIKVTIQGPIRSLASNRTEVPRPATMTVDGVTYPITLTTRGITRKTIQVCDFPPLRVEFTRPAPAGSLFDHQQHLKLVTHCKRSPDFQQKVLLEYSAYKLYNLMTPLSFRVRLANVDYVDETGRPYISRIGYFLEEASKVAKRNAMTLAHMPDTVDGQLLDRAASAKFAVFEYMISNYDWALRAGPKGQECCHNNRLLSSGSGRPLTPVPYDFDWSGLVDAPYAGPPEGINIGNLRQRDYRGYCAHQAEARAFAAQLAPRRAEFLGVFAAIPGLEPREQGKAASFIQGFFNDLDSGKMLKSCVR
jgi:hypothetical protein